ncbi:hypothetical protein MJK72_13300 [Klebsiella pneumoniae]|nr:hypothetical protein MJK72_13300 [Klebsiella pneumoniae]
METQALPLPSLPQAPVAQGIYSLTIAVFGAGLYFDVSAVFYQGEHLRAVIPLHISAEIPAVFIIQRYHVGFQHRERRPVIARRKPPPRPAPARFYEEKISSRLPLRPHLIVVLSLAAANVGFVILKLPASGAGVACLLLPALFVSFARLA